MPVDPRQVEKTFSLMGSSFIGGAGQLIDKLKPASPLTLKRQPENSHDKNAVLVILSGASGTRALGWLPRQLAQEIAPLLDSGVNVIVRKAPPLAKFGAYRGIFELAYIPNEDASNANEQAAGSPASA